MHERARHRRRCCALSTYLALQLGTKKLAEHGFELPEASIAGCCSRHAVNPQCHGDRCPCFPKEPSAGRVTVAWAQP